MLLIIPGGVFLPFIKLRCIDRFQSTNLKCLCHEILNYIGGFLTLFSCTKKDIQSFNHYLKKDPCIAVSVNVDKQDTNDFYVIKTYDEIGVLRHIKTQLTDIQNTTYVFDYDISYAGNKATFNGITRQIDWIPSDTFPNELPNFNPDAPFHPVEITFALEERSFEILFDRKTGYAAEVRFVASQIPLLKLSYDHKRFLKHVTAYGFDGTSYDWLHEPTSVSIREFDVETDNTGNILLVLSDVDGETIDLRGVRYAYNLEKRNNRRNHFYETLGIFIHPMYSLLEILNWRPFQPNKERIGYSIQWAVDPQDELFSPGFGAIYSNHLYNSDGNLTGYDFDGAFNRSLGGVGGFPYHRTRTINWNCKDTRGKNLK